MNYLYTLPNEFRTACSHFYFLPPPALPRQDTGKTMTLSRWICANNSKTQLLQIVHAGGHVELHDRPVTAAEIMCRYPRCRVAYPYVFQQPWAVAEPETVLMLGQKYYVIPNSTIRKLQRLSPRSSPSPSSPAHEITISSSVDEIRNTQSSKEEDDVMLSTCCVFRNKSSAKQSNIYKQYSKNKSKKSEIRADVRNLSLNINNDKNGGLSHDSCFVSMFIGGRTKANASDMAKETRTSSSSAHLCDGNNTLTRKRTKDLAGNGLRSSPKNVWSSEHWQPSLESITEE